MTEVPITTDGFNVDDYWQIKALSIEWLYVMQKLGESIIPKAGEQHVLVGVSFDQSTTYLLKRSYFPPSVIAKATGLPEDKLAKYTGVITLKSTSVAPKEPTVSYWGTA